MVENNLVVIILILLSVFFSIKLTLFEFIISSPRPPLFLDSFFIVYSLVSPSRFFPLLLYSVVDGKGVADPDIGMAISDALEAVQV